MVSALFLQVLSLGVILHSDRCDGAVTTCNPAFTWFGTACRYKCHCTNNRCDSNGECTQSSVCENGWFGPSCQYADLVATSTTPSTPAWVYDFPDILCNPGQETVTISLSEIFYFTWLRLRANAPIGSQDFSLQLLYANGSTVECSNMYTSRFSDSVLDMHCQPGTFFQNIIITGDGVKSLCSVYISEGRNVALGQYTVQDSNYANSYSWLAVDGDNNPNYASGRSCSHTDYNVNQAATWTLAFEQPHHVNIYVIFNRDSNQQRLWGFTLEADQENTSLAFSYTAPTNTSIDIYRIQSTTPHIPVSQVHIIATYDWGGIYVVLCEVQMFGVLSHLKGSTKTMPSAVADDAVCPLLTFGRECEKTCNCATERENCFVSTGGCPSGCAAGYQGEGCQTPCNTTYFGPHCSQTCSTNCKDQDCQPTNGNCLSCLPGKHGPLCDEDCTPTSWGDNCIKPCSSNCKDELCNPVNGMCPSCAAGKSGENCSKACNETFYGEDCALPCSLNCADQLCNATSGNCQSCVNGKSGLFCEEACPATTFGENCSESCSTNCSSQLCDTVNGKCGSCVQGSVGEYCDQNCNQRFYGENCALSCSMNCADQLCYAINGNYLSCVTGKSGLFCDEALPDESPPVAVIVGPVVACVVLAVLFVMGGLIWRKRRQNMTNHGQAAPRKFQNSAQTDNVHTVEANAMTKERDKDGKPPEIKKPNQIQDNTHQQHVDHGYYNFAQLLIDTQCFVSDQGSSMTEHRKKSQEQIKSVQTRSREADPSSKPQNKVSGYEVPVKSAALTQNSQGLKSEDQVTDPDDTMANPYESVGDFVPNIYESVGDISSNIYESVRDMTPSTHEGDIAPNTYEGDIAPSTYEGDIAPSTYESVRDMTPSTYEGDIAPSTYEGDIAPSTYEGDIAPSTYESVRDMTPSTYEGDIAPSTYEGDIAPSTYEGDIAPSTYEGDIAPSTYESVRDMTPSTYEGDITPSTYEGDIAPSTYESVRDMTPSTYEDDITPSTYESVRDMTPSTHEGDIAPSTYESVRDMTPSTYEGDIAPSTYESVRDMTPSTYEDDITPSTYEGDITPSTYESVGDIAPNPHESVGNVELNPYESVSDIVLNPYDEINDI